MYSFRSWRKVVRIYVNKTSKSFKERCSKKLKKAVGLTKPTPMSAEHKLKSLL